MVPNAALEVVVADVDATPRVPTESVVTVFASKRYKYPASPDCVSVEFVQEIIAGLIIVLVALTPVMIGVVGAVVSITTTGFTVTIVEVESDPAVPVTVVVPVDTAVKSPVTGLIVPTLPFELDHAVVVAKGLLY